MNLTRHIIPAAALLLAACVTQAAPQDLSAHASGSQSDMAAETVREVDDAAALAALLQDAFGRRIAPPVVQADFTHQRLLAVFMGRQSHGGFGIRVVRAAETADAVQVDVVFDVPAPNCPTTQMITSPYAIFQFPAGPKPLRYTVQRQIKSC